MRIAMMLSFSAALLALGACAEDRPPFRTSSDAVSLTHTTNAQAPVETPPPAPQSDQELNVGPNLRQACGIDDVARAPKFDFDKARLSSNDKEIASQVALCLAAGPLGGRRVWLVGRADPRGRQEHNVRLGEERALSFKTYLVGLGIDERRILDTSRGALDARGTSEATWRLDRRVDIELAE